MKTIVKNVFLLMALVMFNYTSMLYAQKITQKPLLTVLNLDVQGVNYTPQQLGNLARIELEKLNMFEVMDRYDVAYMIDKHKLKIDNCYGKICLVETGQIIGSDKMLSGSVELYGKTLIITMRLIDVASEKTEKTHVREFLDLPNEIQDMIRISIHEMFELEVNAMEIERLTKKHQFENATINPDKDHLNLSGPRLGATYFTGDIASYLTSPKAEGGFGGNNPLMFMFGYQFEIQYINQGNFQALFEFIPSITGLDQGLVLPSITILNGLRHNLNGWEFALGPTVGLTYKANGYYIDDEWHLEEDWVGEGENPYPIEERVDSRGDISIHTGFVFAVGKSFRSGKMNIPVNAFVIPSNNGIRFGITFGYNARKDKMN